LQILPDFIKKRIVPNETYIIHSVLSKEQIGFPLMIDVGACEGDALLPFLNDGWVIHAFEPDQRNNSRLKKRTRNKSIIINSEAVSNKIQNQVDFYSSHESIGVGSLLKFSKFHELSQTVNTTTLKAYCDENNIDKIDYLKIDVEGHDKQVLEGLDWTRIKPSIVMCEYEYRKTKLLNYTMHDLIRFFEEKKYNVMVSVWNPLKKYGGPHKWCKFVYSDFKSISDDTWGNIIAARDDTLWDNLTGQAKKYSKIWSLNLYYYIRRWNNIALNPTLEKTNKA
jgi:FkbM family methyltransferase|tara:strand:+ start:49 stop:888 length:840 start_codon:yes stop_codon:yes gene_type:complete